MPRPPFSHYLAQYPRNPTEESSASWVRSFEAGAGPAITLLCPCPSVCAPQLASKPPATRPCNTTRCTVSFRSHPPAEQRGYEVTRGKVVCCERPARQWHARGQGFKSPQLHQAQRISSAPAQGRLPEICQSLTARVGQDTVSADRFRQLGNSRREYRRPRRQTGMDVEGILPPDRVAAITCGHHPFGMRFDLPGLG